MNAATYVASYAALVATASTGVRIRSSAGHRRLRIECLLRRGWINDGHFGVAIPALYVTAVNRSGFAVVWDELELAAGGDASPHLRLRQSAQLRIEARDSASIAFARHRLPEGFPYTALPGELDHLTELRVTLLMADGGRWSFVQEVRPEPEPLGEHMLPHTWT
jgi:hypothetical protein